jgi:hypothetical protein
MKAQTFDVELALLSPGQHRYELEQKLAASMSMEDRSDRGWGLVVRATSLQGEALEDQLSEFLGHLSGIEDLVRRSSPVLRIAVFNPSYSCTVLLPKLDRICAMGMQLELSVYPSDQSGE